MFSFRNSRTIPCIRDPFTPTQAPTGSIRSSYDSTATLALSPGMRAIFFTKIKPSLISGTSSSKSLSRNTGEMRERIILGLLFLFSTMATTARTVSPLR